MQHVADYCTNKSAEFLTYNQTFVGISMEGPWGLGQSLGLENSGLEDEGDPGERFGNFTIARCYLVVVFNRRIFVNHNPRFCNFVYSPSSGTCQNGTRRNE